MQTACHLYNLSLERLPAWDRRSRSQTCYRLGECYWSLEEPEKAFEAFQQAVDVDGDNAMARLRLGELLLAGGAVDRAHEQALALLSSGRGDPDVMALLGAASADAGQNAVAIVAFTKVLQADPGRVTVAVALAGIYDRQDRIDEARTVLRKAAQAQPGSSTPMLALGRLEEQEGHLAAAEQAYREAVTREDTPNTNLRLAQFLERGSRVQEAETVLRRVDGMQPVLPIALPDFELLAGKTDKALRRYLDAIRFGPNRLPSTDSAAESEGGRTVLAARIVEADLELVPGSEDPAQATAAARLHLDQYRAEFDPSTLAILRAEVSLAAGDVPGAESQGQTAVDEAPQSAASQYIYGVAKYRAGAAAEARRAWLRALELDDASVPARLALTREALFRGDWDRAESYVEPVLRDEPGNLNALELYAQVLLGQQRLSEARLVAERSSAIDSDDVVSELVLGRIAELQQRYAEALLRFDRAATLDPRSQAAMQGLLRVYRHNSPDAHIIDKMEKLAATTKSAPFMEVAGRLYAGKGAAQDAQRCLKKAVQLDPQRSSAATMLAEMFAKRGDLEAARRSVAGLGGGTAALLSAVAAQRKNDWKGAVVQYEAAVRSGEHSGIAANNLAWLYAEQGTKLDQALALAEQARTLAPGDPAILDTVGVVHLRRREYTDAIQVLRDAAALATKSASHRTDLVRIIHQHLSEAYLRAGITGEDLDIASHHSGSPSSEHGRLSKSTLETSN
jgi:tetratricopeptide (TPR) repeat protein